MNEKEFKETRLLKLRGELYPIIHNKKRNLDELVYMWDFFQEHAVVIDILIHERRTRKLRGGLNE